MRYLAFICAFVICSVGAATAATVEFKFRQVGDSTRLTVSGDINIDDATFLSDAALVGFVNPNSGSLLTSGNYDLYTIDITDLDFGYGTNTSLAAVTGDAVGFFSQLDWLFVPDGYTSGTALDAVGTLASLSLWELGIGEGSFSATYGTTSTHTINVIGEVPVPASGLLLLAAMFPVLRRTSLRAA